MSISEKPHNTPKIKLNFDLNDGCNLNCLMCGTRSKPADQKVIPLEVFKEKILPLFPQMSEFQLGCHSEPLLIPYFEQLAYLIGANMTPGLSGRCISNGTLLTEKISETMLNSGAFSRIRFSWDASHRSLYESIRRGANFDKTLTGIKQLVALRNAQKKPIAIEFNTTILPENCTDLPDIVRLAADLGIDRVTTHKLFPNDYKWVSDDYYSILQESLPLASQIAKDKHLVFEGQTYRTRLQFEEFEQKKSDGSIRGVCQYSGSTELALIMLPTGSVISPCRKLHKPLANIFTDSLAGMLELGLDNLLAPYFETTEECCLNCHLFTEQLVVAALQPTTPPSMIKQPTSDLPVDFFTIVLNGEPFIRHHIEVFSKLPFRWHWHIVEGVARQTHDSSWCAKNGGSITGELHQDGLSNDGTSEYLDELLRLFPDNISLYRKPAGQFWDGKLEMVNAPLVSIRHISLLWQIDCDEFWNCEQIARMRDLFLSSPHKTAAQFICNFYVGPGLATSTVNTYGNNTSFEWKRCWKYEPEDRWLSHSPPVLGRMAGEAGQWLDVSRIDSFSHLETTARGLIFDHYAYTTTRQLAFKETYYGYSAALENWKKLQQASDFPILLRKYFPWVHDETKVVLTPLSTIAHANILVFCTDSGKNIELSINMLQYLPQRYPGATVTVVCQDNVASFYDAYPFVQGIISFNYNRFAAQAAYRQIILNMIDNRKPTLLLNPVYNHDLPDLFLGQNCRALLKIFYCGDYSLCPQGQPENIHERYSLIIENKPDDLNEHDRDLTFLKGIGIAPDMRQ